jgi:uncharacterized protein YodC (DUF2158 family)
MEQFKPGDVVQLKSGGPKMTVRELEDQTGVVCVWFAGSKRETARFEASTLVKWA